MSREKDEAVEEAGRLEYRERLARAKEKGVHLVVMRLADPWFKWDVIDVESLSAIARFHEKKDAMLFTTTANFLWDCVDETFRRNFEKLRQEVEAS